MIVANTWNILLIIFQFICVPTYVNLQSAPLIFGDAIYVQNLDKACLRCLCVAATNCEIGRKCYSGYCGPYHISKIYWADAGKVVLPNDDPDRDQAYEDCVGNMNCAQRVVANYLAKYGRDCNNDGVTDCADFSRINFNGGWECHIDMSKTKAGKNWTRRYDACVA